MVFIVILKHFLMLFRAPLAGIIRKFTPSGPKLVSDIMVLLLPGILKTWSLLEVKSRYSCQRCGLRKIMTIIKVLNHEILGAQHFISLYEKSKFPSRPRVKGSHLWHLGTSRAQLRL